jgi:hypothetical protein
MRSAIVIVFVCLLGALECAHVKMSQDPPPIITANKTTHLTKAQTPQFVMLTYDDAVTITNWNATYQRLFAFKNKANNCPVSATFFVSHENANYQLVYDLYSKGHEIASHTITHQPPQDYWKRATAETVMKEIIGQRETIHNFAGVPLEDIKGYRAPFLQTSGDVTFDVLAKNGFTYDSSMPTQSNSKPWPIFPYTLDDGFRQDCVIPPCPANKYPGFFEIPLVDYWRERVISDGPPPVMGEVPCSMVDMCLPAPANATDAENYFMSNFQRHYKTNHAPFPVFLHEAWLSLNETVNKEGYFNFIKKVTQMDDVFFVTIQEVIEWMSDPIPLDEYAKKACKTLPDPTLNRCAFDIKRQTETEKICSPPLKGDDDQLHTMRVCTTCPTHYPRLGHTSGDD